MHILKRTMYKNGFNEKKGEMADSSFTEAQIFTCTEKWSQFITMCTNAVVDEMDSARTQTQRKVHIWTQRKIHIYDAVNIIIISYTTLNMQIKPQIYARTLILRRDNYSDSPWAFEKPCNNLWLIAALMVPGRSLR